MANLPSVCTSCGAVFPSRAYNFPANVQKLVTSDNTESCPFCGREARLSDGVFNVTDNVVTVLAAPEITRQMLAAFNALAKKAYLEKAPADVIEKEAEQIHPEFGRIIRENSGNLSFPALLLVIVLAIKSCSVDIDAKLDVNRLVDQIQGKAPTELISDETDNNASDAEPAL